MKKKLFVMAVAVMSVATFSSCAKKGCTDSNAENYYEKAKKDDGSCTYKSSIAFWYSQSTSDALWNDGSDALYFYVDNKLIGSSAADTYWNKPTCSSLGPVNYTFDLGKSKTKTVSYKVKDDLDDIINEGNVTLKGGECTIMEVVYP
ncbi:MAG TPA: hypothetical protein DIU39_08615 [Flavobacteriales bacterium]|nr:hypothetical protein [Flavobacteriales bacterium]|tara:strand:- start:86347 stop:86787 length:441 start_codon:yes stop_codon:yes gene_type:complete